MKILLAFDGTPVAEQALTDLELIGLGDGVDVVVLNVCDVWIAHADEDKPHPHVAAEWATQTRGHGELSRLQAQRAVDDAREVAQQARARLLARHPRWRVRAQAHAGSPAGEIVEWAERESVDLIVMGSHGRTALGRFFLGSVSQRVVQEAHCSVHVARPRAAREGPPRIVVGLDGSKSAEAALRAVCERRWGKGTVVRLITVSDPLVLSFFGRLMAPLAEAAAAYNEEDVLHVRERMESYAERVRAAGLEAVADVVRGEPSRALVHEAEAWQADVMFVGAHGLRRVERMLLGSVSAAVAARAHCSVEVVRTGTLEPAAP